MNSFLEDLNKNLEDKTFLIGVHISFADLSVFIFIRDAMVPIEDARKYELYHVFRW